MNDPWRNAQGATEEKTNKNGAKTTLKNKDVVYMNDEKTKALKWAKTPFPVSQWRRTDPCYRSRG